MFGSPLGLWHQILKHPACFHPQDLQISCWNLLNQQLLVCKSKTKTIVKKKEDDRRRTHTLSTCLTMQTIF